MNTQNNPLPKADIYSQTQRESIDKFSNLLPKNMFVFRDERVDDAGVDGSLEILIDDCYSNMRAQVQLKSQQEKTTRKDGTVILDKIETSNFNYLLNGNLGIYILYTKNTGELFYAWATEENHRRQQINSDWTNQGEISIPVKKLDTSCLQEIYEKIYRENLFSRQIRDTLARSSSNDKISVSINPTTLENQNSIEVEEILLNHGMTLISAGYAKQVLDKIDIIGSHCNQKSRIKLIRSYANFTVGRYQNSLSDVSDALLKNDLENEDKKFAEKIRISSQLKLGNISFEDYYNEIAKLNDEELLVEIRLQKLVNQYSSQKFQDDSILREILELKNKVATSKDFSSNLKFGISIKYIEIIGINSILSFLGDLINSIVRIRILNCKDKELINLRNVLENIHKWNLEADELIKYAGNIKNPIFLADALLSKAYISFLALISNGFLMDFLEGQNSFNKETVKNEFMKLLDLCAQSLSIYGQAEMIEGQVRTKLIQSQIFEVIGNKSLSQETAKEAQQKSKILGYKNYQEASEEILSGNSLFAKTKASISDLQNQQQVGIFDISPLMTDQGIEKYANDFIKMYSLPKGRKSNVILEIVCFRDINIEKREFCRHIEVIQNLQHTTSKDTFYAVNPDRIIRCSEFDYQTYGYSPENIMSFKNVYCTLCPKRSPGESI